jgi:hypothetical protein
MPVSTEEGGNRHFAVRRKIMVLLYDRFRELPYAFTELELIEEFCGASRREVNWNLVYLEKSGYLELNKTPDSYPHVASGAALTAKGIDLVENPAEFDRKFPMASIDC